MPLLCRLWNASDWHCCADGGANRLHDLLLLSGRRGSSAAVTVAPVDTNTITTTTTTTTMTTATTAAATATTTTTTATVTPADWLMGWIAGLVRWIVRWPQRRATTSEIDDYLPDLIKGDLDSVRDDVRRYYEARVSCCNP
jgi:hypothetical protein